MNKIIFYLSRILSIIMVAFFALFILEGFSPEFGWQSGLAHFFVALIVLLATIFAWKKPKYGCWFFIILGLYYLVLIAFPNNFLQGLTIGGIPLLIGALFFIEGNTKK